jgi:hypothetical protein
MNYKSDEIQHLPKNLLNVSVRIDVKDPDRVGRSGSLSPAGDADDRVARLDEAFPLAVPESKK